MAPKRHSGLGFLASITLNDMWIPVEGPSNVAINNAGCLNSFRSYLASRLCMFFLSPSLYKSDENPRTIQLLSRLSLSTSQMYHLP